MASNIFKEVTIPYHKNTKKSHFPIVFSPNTDNLELSELTDCIKSHKQWLDSALHHFGAILLRGFPVLTPFDFDNIVQSFGFQELPYVGGAAPRTNVVGRVFTANESPLNKNIPFHHEMALAPEFPSKLFFFCEVEPEPGTGGETPIVLSHIVYERMKEMNSEFVQRLEEHGLIYTRVFSEEDDLASPIGRGWKSIFSTDDKNVAEQRAAKLGMKLEWMPNNEVKTLQGPISGIKYDETRQRKTWFNSMAMAHTEWKGGAVTLGDGKPLPNDIISNCLKILDEECVSFHWQKGDILLLDNLAVLHSRRSCTSPRRVLASLCKY